MTYKVLYIVRMIAAGIILMLLAKISYGQNKVYIQDKQVITGVYNLLDEYFYDCYNDSTEIRQIGVIEQVVTREFAGYYGRIATWNAVIKQDTTWYDEKTFLGYNTLETIYRRVWIHKTPTFQGFKEWLNKRYY